MKRTLSMAFMVGVLLLPHVARAQTPPVNSLTVGPGRQLLAVGQTVPMYVGNFNASTFHVTTHFAYFDKHNFTFVKDNTLPLEVSPTHFLIHNGEQLTVNVTLLKPVRYPMVAVAFDFKPAHLTGSGVAVSATLYGELTTHPEAVIFQPPLTPSPKNSSLYWLPVGLLLLLVLGSVDFVRRRVKQRPHKPHKKVKQVKVADRTLGF